MFREIVNHLIEKDYLIAVVMMGIPAIVVLVIVACITGFQVLELFWGCK